MTIIHVSTDYPDAFAAQKTRAISNLVEATSQQFDHYVYALNRTELSPLQGIGSWLSDTMGSNISNVGDAAKTSTWTYAAPAKGVLLRSSLNAVADRLAEDIAAKGLKPTLIQGHKLSMEGLIAERLARHFDVPYAITIQGNSDRNILNVRRDLWPLYGRIFHGAAVVFPFTPWALQYCERNLGRRTKETVMLPCMTQHDKIIAPRETESHVMSAFHLRHWQIKNFDILVKAAHIVRQQNNVTTAQAFLTIYGSGEPELAAMLEQRASEFGHGAVALDGELSGDAIQPRMNASALFAMVSKRESFGMVFVEALLAGCPILYPQDTAVDGYFDNHNFAQAVPSDDAEAVAYAMTDMLASQKALKDELARWQQFGAAQAFQREAIRDAYIKGLRKALETERQNDAG